MASRVTIRAFEERDQADVCRIWVKGLEQSKLAVPWLFRPWFMGKMNGMRDSALAPEGDVGPNGQNLLNTYGGKTDRCLFVACLGDPETVVGCCAVKKGMDETATEDDSRTGSIWRMSVDETHRGHGTATKLMDTCEDWARSAGCDTMGLYTINPVAAEFYVERMGYTSVSRFHVIDNPIAKRIVSPVQKYEKSLY